MRFLGETRLAELEQAVERLDHLNRQRDATAVRIGQLRQEMSEHEFKALIVRSEPELKAQRTAFERNQARRAQYYPDGAPIGDGWSIS